MKSWLIAFIVCISVLFGEKHDVLFICFDAGETTAFIPVMEQMEKIQEDYQIVAMGTACDLIEKTPLAKKSFFIKKDCQTGEIIERNWPREKQLSLKQVEEIVSHHDPRVVISGVAASFQKQLLNGFGAKSITVAFWDNFSPNGEGDYFRVAHQVKDAASFLFLPSQSVAQSPEFQHAAVKVSGQPSLEKWGEKIKKIDLETLKKKWSENELLITYIGGYGAAYEKAFALFRDCVDEMQKKAMKVKIFVQMHPKAREGLFEQKSLASRSGYILSTQSGLTTEEAVALADVVVCYNSTVGFQALSLGKRSIFVAPIDDPYTNLAIEKKLSKRAATPSEFLQILDEKLPQNLSFYQTLGIPKNSTEEMLFLIRELLTKGIL